MGERTNTHTAPRHSATFQIRFHGNPDWDHIACCSICSVPTCVVFVFFITSSHLKIESKASHGGIVSRNDTLALKMLLLIAHS